LLQLSRKTDSAWWVKHPPCRLYLIATSCASEISSDLEPFQARLKMPTYGSIESDSLVGNHGGLRKVAQANELDERAACALYILEVHGVFRTDQPVFNSALAPAPSVAARIAMLA
jgi:hypothetical protein